jgi:hypothetical protein
MSYVILVNIAVYRSLDRYQVLGIFLFKIKNLFYNLPILLEDFLR